MIGIINYGSGNVRAISNIYRNANIEHMLISQPDQLGMATRFILPGVGAFDESMRLLQSSGMLGPLSNLVLVQRRPVLGVCVGMQMMARCSAEGNMEGLGWIDGEVLRIPTDMLTVKPHLPHMGWNTIRPARSHEIFSGVDYDRGFYFLHSYYFSCTNPESVLATTTYGAEICTAVVSQNILGFQFHPEKSHANGISLLKNFATKFLC